MKILKNIRRRTAADENPSAAIALNAPVSGKIVSLSDVNDATFSELILGEGIAIVPENGVIVAPEAAVIESVPHSRHAISMTTDSGISLLIHVGLDTVELDGKYFRIPVSVGDRVKAGDVLIEADLEGIRNAGYDTVTPVVVTNTEDYVSVTAAAESAEAGMPLLLLEAKPQ